MTSKQIPLRLGFPVEQRFETFEPAEAEAVSLLRDAATAARALIYLSGPSGSGKSHLLQAACAEASAAGRSIGYLPLWVLGEQAVRALDAQPAVDLLCIDGLEAIAGSAEAERAMFALHNRLSDAVGSIIYAARTGSDALPLVLPDLRSRLQHCTRIMVAPLNETQRREWLQRRALARGLQLDEAVLDYVFRHVGRDLETLAALLDRLDRESLAAHRRITVPFLRSVINSQSR